MPNKKPKTREHSTRTERRQQANRPNIKKPAQYIDKRITKKKLGRVPLEDCPLSETMIQFARLLAAEKSEEEIKEELTISNYKYKKWKELEKVKQLVNKIKIQLGADPEETIAVSEPVQEVKELEEVKKAEDKLYITLLNKLETAAKEGDLSLTAMKELAIKLSESRKGDILKTNLKQSKVSENEEKVKTATVPVIKTKSSEENKKDERKPIWEIEDFEDIDTEDDSVEEDEETYSDDSFTRQEQTTEEEDTFYTGEED